MKTLSLCFAYKNYNHSQRNVNEIIHIYQDPIRIYRLLYIGATISTVGYVQCKRVFNYPSQKHIDLIAVQC